MAIQKLNLVATSDNDADWQVEFSLDTMLVVSGLRLPKPEKGAEIEASFLLSADTCASVADMVEEMSLAETGKG